MKWTSKNVYNNDGCSAHDYEYAGSSLGLGIIRSDSISESNFDIEVPEKSFDIIEDNLHASTIVDRTVLHFRRMSLVFDKNDDYLVKTPPKMYTNIGIVCAMYRRPK